MKKVFNLFSLLMLITTLSANGFLTGSIGTRARAMGGAYTALADDASAIYWNPAALINQSASVMYEYTGFSSTTGYRATNEDYNFSEYYSIDTESEESENFDHSIFINYPKDRFAIAVGMYTPVNLQIAYQPQELQYISSYFAENGNEWLADFKVTSITSAFGYRINRKFSLGAAFNVYYGEYKQKKTVDTFVSNSGEHFSAQYSDNTDGIGYGGMLSILYKATDEMSLGFSFKMPVELVLEGTAICDSAQYFNPVINSVIPTEIDVEKKISIPFSLSAGLAVKPSEKMVVSVDINYTDWQVLDNITSDYSNIHWIEYSEPRLFNTEILEWESRVSYKIGLEYKPLNFLAMRAGYYSDPSPVPTKTINILYPFTDNQVYTAGIGLHWKMISIDTAIEYFICDECSADLNAYYYDVDQNGINSPSEMIPLNHPGDYENEKFNFSAGVSFSF